MNCFSPHFEKGSSNTASTPHSTWASSQPVFHRWWQFIQSFISFKAKRTFFLKPYKVKMWNIVTNIEGFFLRALLMKSTSFADELLKFAFLLFTTWPPTLNTLSPASPVDIMQNVYLYIFQDHWVSDTPICGFANTGECRYTLVPQAFCSVEFLAHITFTFIETTFSYPHKQFLIPYSPGKCGYLLPVQDSSVNISFLVCGLRFL